MSADIFNNVATDDVSIAIDETQPEDVLSKIDDRALSMGKREKLEPDNALPKQSKQPFSQYQRKQLDLQIEGLYNRVAHELSDSPTDINFAFNKLRQAQDIVLENIQQYEEGLNKIFVVNQMLVTKQNWKRWSYTWGLFLFFYAIVWLVAILATFFVKFNGLSNDGLSIWFASLAGGIGGVVTILYDLYWHVSIKNDFDRQYVMKYLVQPIMGMVLGGVIYLITGAGFLAINSSLIESDSTFLGGALAIQVLLGFVAGFRQQVIYDLVEVIIQRLSISGSADKG